MMPRSLEEQAQEFGDELTNLLAQTLPSAPSVGAEYRGRHVVVSSPEDGIPLFVQAERLATLRLKLRCRLDSWETWLAIEESSCIVSADLDRTPVLRFDYRRDAEEKPSAHIQVHAHRGALSHLLSRAGHPSAHDMAELHIPVGGARFRPSVEDVIQFLVIECRFDALGDWKEAVHGGRERWRRRQLRASVRDLPEDAADVLRALGYAVTPPDPLPADKKKALRIW